MSILLTYGSSESSGNEDLILLILDCISLTASSTSYPYFIWTTTCDDPGLEYPVISSIPSIPLIASCISVVISLSTSSGAAPVHVTPIRATGILKLGNNWDFILSIPISPAAIIVTMIREVVTDFLIEKCAIDFITSPLL